MTNSKINHTIVKDISFSLLEEGISVKVRADGYSMYPAIRPGSFIYIEPVTPGSLPCPGDIVAWKRDCGFVVHRLVRILKNGSEISYITRGDSCSLEDKPVSILAGKVVKIENEKGIAYSPVTSAKPRYLFNRWRVLGILIFNKMFSN
jgi:signal peptidase I